MFATVTVTVPATTANIGPGFDCLGAALGLYNRFSFRPSDVLTITATGLGAERVPLDQGNLAHQAFVATFKHLGKIPPAIALDIELAVPLARGLGSSSTAIVGGILGANALAGSLLSKEQVGELAIQIEGHPDNVIPALMGGCRLAVQSQDDWTVCPVPWHQDVQVVVAIPDFELSTAEARRVLPQSYSRADAIFNTAHVGLLLRGLETGNHDWLRAALQDRIHQPYRQGLIPGYEAMALAAEKAGADGLVISGAGPTLLAIAAESAIAAVTTALKHPWQDLGITADVKPLSIQTAGASVVENT
jgi:homoserine kinase